MASLEEEFRIALLDVIRDWRIRVEACIEEAKESGEITTVVDSHILSQFFWSAWEGAVLCSKLERSSQPLQIIGDLFISELLRPAVSNK
jgi:TetR/AcrR family transcriptional repressor of nem operon